MHAVVPVYIEEQACRAFCHMDNCSDLAAPQLVDSPRLIKGYRLHVDPQCLKENRTRDEGAAVGRAETHPLPSEIGDTGDLSPRENMHLFLIQLRSVADRGVQARKA